LHLNLVTINIMAIPIKSPPVLVGKAAEEFYERWAQAKCSKSKEEVQESMRTTLDFLAKQEHLHKSYPWSI